MSKKGDNKEKASGTNHSYPRNDRRLLDFARLLFSVLPENALEEAHEKLGRVEFGAHWDPRKEPTPVIYKVQEALRKMLPVDRQRRYFQHLVEGLDLQEAPFIVDATHWNVRDEDLRRFDEVTLWNKANASSAATV